MKHLIFAVVIVVVLFGFTPEVSGAEEEQVWLGQEYIVTDVTPGETYSLIDSESGNTITTKTPTDTTLAIDTTEYGTGSFNLSNTSTGEQKANYVVNEENFSVESDRTIAYQEPVNFTFLSDRQGFDVHVESEEISDETLISAIDEAELSFGDVIIRDVSDEDEIAFDPSSLDVGDYELTWSVTDTESTDETPLQITDTTLVGASFDEGTYTVAKGDPVEVTVETENTQTLQFEVADLSETYTATAEFIDEDGDGEISFLFYTGRAGLESNTEPVFEPQDGTELTVSSENLQFEDGIDKGAYTINALLEDDIIASASLGIEETDVDDPTVKEMPQEFDPDVYSSVVDSFDDSTVTASDYVAIAINASGIHDVLTGEIEYDDIRESGVLDDEYDMYVEIVDDDEDEEITDVASVFSEPNNGQIAVVLDPTELTDYEHDGEIDRSANELLDASVTLNGTESTFESLYGVEDTDEFSANFTIEEPSLTVDARESDGGLSVIDNSDNTITFNTNYADNREVTFESSEYIISESHQVSNSTVTPSVINTSLGEEFSLSVSSPEEQSYGFVVGSQDIITQLTAPDEVLVGETFESTITTTVDEDLEYTWTVGSETYTDETLSTTPPTEHHGGEFTIEVNAESGDNIYFGSETVDVSIPEPEITIDMQIDDGNVMRFDNNPLTMELNTFFGDHTIESVFEYNWYENDVQQTDGDSEEFEVNVNRSVNRIEAEVVYDDVVFESDQQMFYRMPRIDSTMY